jgi:hypothetical protein
LRGANFFVNNQKKLIARIQSDMHLVSPNETGRVGIRHAAPSMTNIDLQRQSRMDQLKPERNQLLHVGAQLENHRSTHQITSLRARALRLLQCHRSIFLFNRDSAVCGAKNCHGDRIKSR